MFIPKLTILHVLILPIFLNCYHVKWQSGDSELGLDVTSLNLSKALDLISTYVTITMHPPAQPSYVNKK
jgi:hypothetical protein